MAYLKSEVERLHNEGNADEAQSPQAAARLPAPPARRRFRSGHMRGVSHAVVEHDGCCAIFQRHTCNCTPDISIRNGGSVLVIDAQGAVSRTGKQ